MGKSVNDNPALPVGDIAFFDNYIPSLEDGIYTISAKTEIKGSIDTGTYFDKPVTQVFEVRGPQFSLAPNEVHSVYPPANSNSAYDQYLPNIVLDKRVLPWERVFNVSDKTIPWLCLMVFAEGEIAIDKDTNSPLTNTTVKDFLSPADDVLKPAIPLDSVPADVLPTACATIQVTAGVFNAIVPKIGELKYLAHVRQVNTGDQAIMGFEDMGWFSVVTGNRLLVSAAETGTRFYVHLVSLEGYYGIMSGATPWPKKKSDPSQPQDIALASLYNWTFLSQPEKLNFAQLVENFASQSGGNPDNLLLRRPAVAPSNPDPATKATLARLQNGYVPLNYLTPTGDTTFAWYRGPLTPVIAQPLPRPSEDYHFPSSSSMMIYDKATGIFDQSYSAAWSLGQALALADGNFSQALMDYRKKSYSLIGRLMDVLVTANEASQADLAQIIQSSAVRNTFRKIVGEDLGTKLTAIMRREPAASRNGTPLTAPAAPPNPVDTVNNFLAEPAVQDFLKEEIEDDLLPVAAWLARKQLLYDIPFDHLVPDQLALPVESLRFFYIDQNWLDSLVDGALGIGVQSSKDSFLNGVMRGVINDTIGAETKLIRSRLLGTATGDTEKDSPAEALSGILVRSAVVSGWPGLAVKAFKGDFATGTPLKLLRMDRLSANVLLCIFLDIPDTIMIAEPQQGLCFGVEDGDVINLRQLSNPPGKPMGKPFPATGGFKSFYRAVTGGTGQNVLNINDGNNSVVQTLQQSSYLNATIGPAQFALEMVKAPEEISFTRSK
jgi:hypothetical protein